MIADRSAGKVFRFILKKVLSRSTLYAIYVPLSVPLFTLCPIPAMTFFLIAAAIPFRAIRFVTPWSEPALPLHNGARHPLTWIPPRQSCRLHPGQSLKDYNRLRLRDIRSTVPTGQRDFWCLSFTFTSQWSATFTR